jgi:transposase
MGREVAAWIGLVPRQNSSGGKERLGHISKKGDPYLRKLLVLGAHAVLRYTRSGNPATTKWATSLLSRKPYRVAAVAIANKMARIVWAPIGLLARKRAWLTAPGDSRLETSRAYFVLTRRLNSIKAATLTY